MKPKQPFYFIVVVWGKQFRDYLTNYCIPSLLAPDNLPKLTNTGSNKFLICTTKKDWEELKQSPALKNLREYIDPVLIEIPLPPTGTSSCQHIGVGHKLATDMCFNDKAYGIAITPDLVISNGTLKTIQEKALLGYQVVLTPAIRFAEEPFFAELKAASLSSHEGQLPLTLTERQLVKFGLKSFHSETESYDFESLYYGATKPVSLWRMPNEQGLIIYSLSWCPMMIDYGKISHHDTSALEEWTMDGDYIHKNFEDINKIYASQDSDEMILISWAPYAYNQVLSKPNHFSKKFKHLINRYYLMETLRNPIFDPTKLALFPLECRWHVNDINTEWDLKSECIKKEISDLPIIAYYAIKINLTVARTLEKLLKYCFILIKTCCGSKKAKQQLITRIKLYIGYTDSV